MASLAERVTEVDRVDAVLDREDGIAAAFQPIIRAEDGAVFGYEALARPRDPDLARPERFLAAAERAGRGTEAQLACWRAVAAAGAPPDRRLVFLNVSPIALSHPGFLDLAAELPRELVIELTERDVVADYDVLRHVLEPWLARGTLLAVDDLGEGPASLELILELAPQFIKLARGLVRDIHLHRRRRSLVGLLSEYAARNDVTLIAEGVECAEELAVLRALGVECAQGFLIGEPAEGWPAPAWPPLRAAPPSFGHSDIPGLAGAPGVREACQAVVEHVARRDLLMPMIYLERGGMLRCHAVRGYWQLIDGIPAQAGIVGRAFSTGETVVVDDVQREPAYLKSSPEVTWEACVPIRCGGEVIGVLGAGSPVVPPAGAPIELERAAEQLGRRIAELGGLPLATPSDRLARHAAELPALVNAEEIADRVTAAAIDISGLDSAMVATEGLDGRFHPRSARGPLATSLVGLHADALAKIASWVETVRSCYTVGDPGGHGFTGHEVLRTAGVESVAVFPLEGGDGRRGILLLGARLPIGLRPQDVELLELLAAQASACLRTAASVSRLRERAASDPLTGLGHHATFHATLADARSRIVPGSRVGVILIDLDGFKQVNDSHGHQEGDRVLREVAAALSGALRSTDRLFRVGGDEFAALVAVSSSDEALSVGHRLVDAVRALGEDITVSVGVAVADPGETDEQVYGRADQAMYSVKRAGRDGAALASPAGVNVPPGQAALWD